MKTCKICNKAEPEVAFEKGRRQCKPCRAEYRHAIKLAWYARNKEYAIAKTREWREKNPERKLAYRKSEYAKNADKAKFDARIYRKNNPAKVNHWSRLRQCAKAKRVPGWLSSDDKWLLGEIYDLSLTLVRHCGIS